MSSWVPPGGPPLEAANPACEDHAGIMVDYHVITCLEAALEKRREEASNAEAPMPMGVGTSSFRTANRGDPVASMPVANDADDDDMEDIEGDELASDQLTDDGVFGLIEEVEQADAMTDGSAELSLDDDHDHQHHDDDDDDDDNLAGYL